ncbi:hypothetical protein [Cupriavidus sp. RAF12]|uniref:hypothetical protein n=1 Tax=Cupriavidus sp. RAF12 TaxID=3233050 RepID=UPI003F8EF7D7
MNIKQRMAAIATLGALSAISVSAFAAPAKFDVYSGGQRVGAVDTYTDGARVNDRRDVYTDGARVNDRRDVYLDGARVNDKRDAFTDGA